MVGHVAGDDIGQGAHGNGVVAGDAAAQPGVGRKIAEESECGRTYRAKLLEMIRP